MVIRDRERTQKSQEGLKRHKNCNDPALSCAFCGRLCAFCVRSRSRWAKQSDPELLLFEDPKRFPGLSKIRVVSQRRLDLAFRLIDAVHLRQSNSIVESGSGKAGLQPDGNGEVIARLIETTG